MKEYINYIETTLNSLPKGLVKASYNTGYGLRLVTQDIGPEAHIMDIIPITVIKIDTPRLNGDDWFIAWDKAIELVNNYIANNK